MRPEQAPPEGSSGVAPLEQPSSSGPCPYAPMQGTSLCWELLSIALDQLLECIAWSTGNSATEHGFRSGAAESRSGKGHFATSRPHIPAKNALQAKGYTNGGNRWKMPLEMPQARHRMAERMLGAPITLPFSASASETEIYTQAIK